MSSVTLEGVTKVFDDGTVAVDHVDLEIADGELLVLVGPSGSGKTTVLRLTAGLEELTEGEIRIGPRVVNGLHPMDRDIAMVFQSYALYPHMTVRENIGFGLRLRHTPKSEIRERVEATAAKLGLTDLLKRKPAQLSGGQRQRVAMGRAIVRDPAAFLMDEPLSNLDAKLRVQTRTEVSRLQRRLGTTMVYVTHDQTEAMTLGDRLAVLRNGVLQQVGSPEDMYGRPVNLFVAGFIGSPAMNFLPGTVEDGKMRTPLGDIPLHDRLRQALERAKAPRDLIVGIRPENFEDAALVSAANRPNGITFHATIDVLESLGSDVFVYFTKELAQGVDAAELQELAADSGRAEAGVSGDTVVARLDTATTIREGQDTELWLDARAMHLFDPGTGRNLTLEAAVRADESGPGRANLTSGAAGESAAPSQAAPGAASQAREAAGPAASGQEAVGPAASGQEAAGPAASGQEVPGPAASGQEVPGPAASGQEGSQSVT